MSYTVFINYRRADAGPYAELVKKAVATEFGESHVFMDVSSIAPGDEWPDEIESKLKSADALVAVIGPDWFKAGIDEWGRRRIDQPDDWVRKELVFALESKKLIIPLLVGGAKAPPPEALPDCLKKLPLKQALPIRMEFWDHDIKLLQSKLASESSDSCTSHDDIGPYPKSNLPPRVPLSEQEIEALLKSDLQHWKVQQSPLPKNEKRMRQELARQFTFDSFADAIRFMNQVASGCDSAMHHPRWENVFKTLSVFLSSWDGNLHAITQEDVHLAKYFDWAFDDFRKLPARREDPT